MVPITARKYDGAVAVGSLFVMAPQDEDSIGILDAETLIYSPSYSRVPLSGNGFGGRHETKRHSICGWESRPRCPESRVQDRDFFGM
jgi:hypothetical protein